MFTLKQLNYFVTAAELGQVSAAAEQLHISQSAISTAIHELEELLGVALLERKPDGVDFTAAGRKFFAHANCVLDAAENALALRYDDAAVSGQLRLAVSFTLMGYFLPRHLQRFLQRFPGIELRVDEMQREEIEGSLIAGRHDFGVLITANVNNPQIACETWLGSPRRLWLPVGHRLLSAGGVTLTDVANEPYIMLTVDEAADSALRYWSKTPVRPNVLLETSSVEAVRSLVADGMGVTILSDLVYRPWSLEGRRIVSITLQNRIPSMDIGLAWRCGAEVSALAEAFRDYFRQIYPLAANGGLAPEGKRSAA